MRVRVDWRKAGSDAEVILDGGEFNAAFRLQAAMGDILQQVMARKADWVLACLREALDMGISPEACYILEYQRDSLRSTFVRNGVPVSDFVIKAQAGGHEPCT